MSFNIFIGSKSTFRKKKHKACTQEVNKLKKNTPMQNIKKHQKLRLILFTKKHETLNSD